jgi:hypothetical protein
MNVFVFRKCMQAYHSYSLFKEKHYIAIELDFSGAIFLGDANS